MSEQGRQILAEALKLPPVERAELVEQILASFSLVDRKRIDALWAAEAEDRIDAYESGALSSKPASASFIKHGKTL